MFLSLAVVTSLVTLSLSATYNTVVNLPTVQWDFIIVGGIFLVSVVKMLQNADTFQSHRRHSRISPCQQIGRKSSIQCPCSWSRSHVSMPLYNQLFVIIHVDRNVNVTGSIVPGLQLGLANTRYVWNSTSTPQLGLNNRSLSIQRGHILGGSSSVSEYQLCTMLNLDL